MQELTLCSNRVTSQGNLYIQVPRVWPCGARRLVPTYLSDRCMARSNTIRVVPGHAYLGKGEVLVGQGLWQLYVVR